MNQISSIFTPKASPFPRTIARKALAQQIGAIVLTSLVAGSVQAEIGNPRVNQVGYLPDAAKVASYKSTSNTAQSWELRRNGAVVASGTTQPKGIDAASGDNVHLIDISNVTTEGSNYKLYVNGDESYAFDIAPDTFSGALYDSIKYFYHNRSGIAIETQYTGGGNTSYAADSKWARPAGHVNTGSNQGDYDVPCWSGTCNYSLDVTKGWYDAGDHGKYVVNGGISVWKLLTMYERALHVSDNASAFGDNTLNIPESGNGVPDILDEVRWQMEFMLAMQVPEGQAKAGMVHHKVHDVGWTGLPLAPHEDNMSRALVPPSTAATLNVAATAAQCARLWKDIDAAFASTCLTAAERAWDAAQQNPNDIYIGGYDNGGGAYGDEYVADEFFWAAAELYITTGDSKYLPTINAYEIERTDFAWPDTELPGLISLAVVPTEHTASLRTSARQQITAIADLHTQVSNSTGYGTPHTEYEYYWGSNNGVANKLFLVGLAHDFTGNDAYARAFTSGVDYLFGRNPLSFSYISGHGENALTQPHHRFWAGALSNNYPWLPPGVLSGGPNSGLEDDVGRGILEGCQTIPATCFVDNIESWSTNEITINWNSALAWVLAFQDDLSNSGGESSSSSSSSSSNSSEASSSIVSSSSSSSEASSSSSVSISSSSAAPIGGQQCNWYGTLYSLCGTTQAGWGWEDNQSCIAASTCSSQPEPYGIVGDAANSSSANSSVTSSSSSDAISSSASSSSDPVAGGGNCEYVVTNQWSDGFTGAIRITNNGSANISNWNVSWSYSDGSQITNSWNATLTGSNPYSASSLGWNGTVAPGQSVEFGFQGTKGGSSAQIPALNGTACN